MTDSDKIWKLYTKSVKRLVEEPRPVSLKHGRIEPRAQKELVEKDINRKAGKEKPSKFSNRAKATPPFLEKTATKEISKKAIFDKRTERQLRHGLIYIDARLDLHGMTEQDAYDVLHRFIVHYGERGQRKLLIITGKGRDGHAVLRKNLPRWCAEPALAKLILDLRPAAPQHGGQGAWYVFLKNERSRA